MVRVSTSAVRLRLSVAASYTLILLVNLSAGCKLGLSERLRMLGDVAIALQWLHRSLNKPVAFM